jgi:repressor LexA
MLTERMQQCLSAIESFLAEKGIGPSHDELKEALGLRSKSGVNRLVAALEERGYLRRLPYRARALEIIKPQTGPSPDYLRGYRDGAEAERKLNERT